VGADRTAIYRYWGMGPIMGAAGSRGNRRARDRGSAIIENSVVKALTTLLFESTFKVQLLLRPLHAPPQSG